MIEAVNTQIDHNSFVPIYVQIKERILEMIQNHPDINQPFYSDNELATMFDVNRLTIRRAMEDLVERGLIYRVRGLGTFIRKFPKIQGELLYEKGFISQWQLQGRKVNAKVLSVEKIPAKQTIAEALGITEGSEIFAIQRLRFADNLPVIVDDIFLPYPFLEPETLKELETTTVADYLKRRVGKIAREGLIEIEAIKATKRETECLKVKIGDPLLMRSLTFISETGDALSFGISLHSVDLFHYHFKVPIKTD